MINASCQLQKLPGIWKTYDNSSGLLAGVCTIAQDIHGLLWLGTFGGGLSRYDGVEFKNYTTMDGLPDNRIQEVAVDRNGLVWCRFWNNELCSFDGMSFHLHTGPDQPLKGIHRMTYKSVGGPWFHSGENIYRYDGEQFIPCLKTPDPIHTSIWCLFRDSLGRFWVGTQEGVRCYDHDSCRVLTTRDGLIHDNVRAICEDGQGRMWFGTEAGLCCYDGTGFTPYTTQDGLAHSEIWEVHCDSENRIWIGAFGSGLTCYDGEEFVVYTPDDGLLDETVTIIFQDAESSFWFGHVTTGLSHFQPEFFQPLCTSSVSQNGFAQDEKGRLWYGSSYDLGCIDGEHVSRQTLSAQVTDILATRDGGLWVATWGEGIYCYPHRDTVWTTSPDRLIQEHGLTDFRILALMEDRDSHIWAGAENGDLCCYDGTSFRKILSHPGPISTILHDRHGAIWIGSWSGGGLMRYADGHAHTFTTEDGLSFDAVRWIMESRDGFLWICTLGGGIARYDGTQFTAYSFAEGMWNAMAAFAYEDRDGHIWFGTEGGGVHRYNGRNFQVLTRQDGLPSSTICAITQQSDGSIIFATRRGIVRYPLVRSKPPPVLIRQVIADRVYDHKTHIELTTAVADRVTFQFRGICFTTNHICYNYRLEGSDTEWQTTWEEEVVYNRLPPGEYRFQVIAINRDLAYSDTPATVILSVQPDPRDATITALQTEVAQLRREVIRKYEFTSIVGTSSALQQVYALMEKAIDTGLTVLLSGETGTGKELVAKAIHYHSSRKHKPLLELNCGAIPKELVAATLFGYRKGAFTGAYEDTTGLFEAAENGTVILDEIGEMGAEAQVHLLRVLQEQTIQRVGETRLRNVDVRVIAITNRDLETEVQAGRFREDLYYRLSVFPIRLPALRDRIEDLPIVAEHFLALACRQFEKGIKGVAPGVYDLLRCYTWPGNVRELENEVYRAVALVEEDVLVQTFHFSTRVTRGESLIEELVTDKEGYTEAVNRFRKQFVTTVLRECNGNRSETAKRLGMHRPNLVALMKKLGITDLN